MKCGLEAAFKNIGKAFKAANARCGYQCFVKYPQGSKLSEYAASYRRQESEKEKELKVLLEKAKIKTATCVSHGAAAGAAGTEPLSGSSSGGAFPVAP